MIFYGPGNVLKRSRPFKMKTKLHRAEFIKAGVSTGLIAAGGIVCIVLITYSDLHHKSSVVGSSLLQIKNGHKAVSSVICNLISAGHTMLKFCFCSHFLVVIVLS